MTLYLLGTNYQNNLILALSFLLASLFITCIWHCYQNLAGIKVSAQACEPHFVGHSVRFSVLLQSQPRARYALQLSVEGGAEEQGEGGEAMAQRGAGGGALGGRGRGVGRGLELHVVSYLRVDFAERAGHARSKVFYAIVIGPARWFLDPLIHMPHAMLSPAPAGSPVRAAS
mgnify:CR=1 FL=1